MAELKQQDNRKSLKVVSDLLAETDKKITKLESKLEKLEERANELRLIIRDESNS